jgi:hypothetical protein
MMIEIKNDLTMQNDRGLNGKARKEAIIIIYLLLIV